MSRSFLNNTGPVKENGQPILKDQEDYDWDLSLAGQHLPGKNQIPSSILSTSKNETIGSQICIIQLIHDFVITYELYLK